MMVTEQLKDMMRNDGVIDESLKLKEDIAVNLFKDGAEPSFISQVTGLDIAWILMLESKA